MTTKSKMVLGLLGAVTAGVVIGLLVAPDKGSEIRKKIKSKTNGWVNALGTFIPFTKKNSKMGVGEEIPAY